MMLHQLPSSTTRQHWLPAYVIIILMMMGGVVMAEEYQDGFDSEETSWKFEAGGDSAELISHLRTDKAAVVHSGTRSEAIQISTTEGATACRLVHDLPPSLRIDETEVSAWVWSDHPGITVSVRVRFPQQLNPRTKKPLVVYLTGEQHQGGGQYQRLAVPLSDREFASSMRRVRDLVARQLGIRNVNEDGATIDQFVIHLTDEARTWRIAVDDLVLKPVVAPSGPAAAVEPVEYTGPRIRIGDDRILLDGQPLFPLFVPYHGEQPPTLAASLCNVIWVPDYQDQGLLQKCSEAGLGVMATPPQPDFARESPDDAGLVPFGPETDPVLLWMLDARIPASQVEATTAWAEMVRDADRHRERPILADVSASEREFHRSLDFMGASRSVLHTSVSARQYLDTLEARRRFALPGKPMFTLIPTEPSPELLSARFEGAVPPVTEPEQIWMFANAALAAGYKGLGYLTYHSLEGDAPGAEERRRAIEIANFRIRLIEPWLATGKVLQTLPVQVGAPPTTRAGQKLSPLTSRWDVRPLANTQTEEALTAQKIRATALECDQGLVILVNWLEDDSQFQPGAMTTKDVYLLLNRNIVHAWELTTTSFREHTLEVSPVAGGTQIRLKQFDQSAVILISKDQAAEEVIRKRVEQFRPVAAKAWSALARAKLTRVRSVHEELVTLAPREAKIVNAERFLRQAGYFVDQAEKAQAADRLTEVEQHALNALLSLRYLQHAHWSQAVATLSSPVASPHTLCFQTLPDHWRMTSAIEGEIQSVGADSTVSTRMSESENLLPTGEFESLDGLMEAGWTRVSPEQSQITARAELLGPGRAGRSCLHLSAAPGITRRPLPPSLEFVPVTMTSPPIPVRAGQLIRVQGQLRIASPLRNSADGLVISDSLLGNTGALRFREATTGGNWQPFEFFREAPRDGEFQISIELRGIGAAAVDSLQVTAIELSSPSAP